MYRYLVSEEDYLNTVKTMLIDQRGPKKTAVLKLLLKTVVQGGAAAFLIIAYPDVQPWMKWMLGVLSFLWAALSLFQYFFLDFRARLLLSQSKKTPEAADYWKEHRLEIGEDALKLSYGDSRLELPFREVTGLRETETLWMIFRGRDVFESVPKRVVGDEEWAEMRRKIIAGSGKERREAVQELKNTLLNEAEFKTYLQLSHDELTDKVLKMARMSFRYRSGWSGRSIFTFAFPLALAVYCAACRAWPTFALCMAVFLLFNMRLFMVFMPMYRNVIKERLMPPAEDGYLLAVKDKTAYLLGENQAFSYALADLKKYVKMEEGLFVYFDKQAMLYVPLCFADAFLRAAGLMKSLHIRASAGFGTADPEVDEADQSEDTQ